jgi:penicillin G amidase
LARSGLRAEAIIRRDRHGVPYIHAESEHDAWWSLGFCHGQDRPLQLEITLRAVRGTLAALIGPDGLGVDRISRRLGFRRAADAQLPHMRPEVRAQLAAYVRGINAARAGGPKPHALTLLGKAPTPWEPGDVQGYAALFCFALAANWDAELMRLKVLLEDGPEALRALETVYPSDLPSTLHPLEAVGPAIDHFGHDLEAFRELVGFGGGSNAWALAPSKTASGRALLANDPHLMSQAPPLNYLAQIRAPGVEVAGATWVGLPAFGPGHNGFAAWGVTAAHADNTDLFLEQIGPDGTSLRDGDGFVPCEVRDERIAVRGESDVVERVLVGPRGPLLTQPGDPALPDIALPPTANALSFRATWLDPRPYRGLFRAFEARSFEAFCELFEEGSTSALSAVYADVTGKVGTTVAVEAPVRGCGRGLVPLPGWDASTHWRGLVPPSGLPRSVDPVEGFVCTANNQPTRSGEGPFLGADWLDGYRQQAIARALAARDDWDVANSQALQRDTTSIPWEQMRAVVLALDPEDDDDARVALTLLRHWDGRLSSHSLTASVYAVFLCKLCHRVVTAKAPRTADWAMGRAFTELLPHSTMATRRTGHLVRLVVEQPSGWFDDWSRELVTLLGDSVRELRRRHGDDPADWAWGRVRPLVLEHPLSQAPGMAAIFDIGPFEGAGDNTTIAQGGLDFTDPLHNQVALPALRAVIDVGRWDEVVMAVLGGQSGNPFSPHYVDQADAWHSGNGVSMAWSDAAIASRCRLILRVSPS